MSGNAEDMDAVEPEVWYKAGIKFECQRCGDCCRAHGVVWVKPEEVAKIAYYLGMGYSEFRNKYLRDVDGRLTIGETDNGECLLFDPKTDSCSIYPVRPDQCSSYPFWPRCLANPEVWSKRREKCPGIDEGRLWTYEEIMQRMRVH
jgi:Fe-S-cluster containining protein